jgi:hypothetical protein
MDPSYLSPKQIVDINYQKYRKEGCSMLTNIILEELIARTWHPDRIRDWCWDEEEKKFMNEICILN